MFVRVIPIYQYVAIATEVRSSHVVQCCIGLLVRSCIQSHISYVFTVAETVFFTHFYYNIKFYLLISIKK